MIEKKSFKDNLPKHLAIVMDGNGRWAKKRGLSREHGHMAGARNAIDIIKHCSKIGIKYLTLYVFSIENWQRPENEISNIIKTLCEHLITEKQTLIDNDISLNAIGDLCRLPTKITQELKSAKRKPNSKEKLTLTLAISYSGKNEIMRAVRKIASRVKNKALDPRNITEKTISENLDTRNMPDPDLLIRTSGEMRLSNFMLWQLSYTEIHITQICWPDFSKEDLSLAINEYKKRQRRFGKITKK